MSNYSNVNLASLFAILRHTSSIRIKYCKFSEDANKPIYIEEEYKSMDEVPSELYPRPVREFCLSEITPGAIYIRL